MELTTIKVTKERWETIYTALLLECKRHYGQGTEDERLLNEVIEAVCDAL